VSERPKALIVGAGPTGLVRAHELARDGIQCRLIDKAPHRAMESRAIAIHSRTVEAFELVRLADAFLSAGHRITGVNVYGESERIAHAAFGMLDTRYPFVLGVPQDETERILEERVARHGVRVASPHSAAHGRQPRGRAAYSAPLAGKRLCSASHRPARNIRRRLRG
jgi:2-polyprenyl-6-methoxyphenol hydroxylase-like FAD-dependent oxidoreductase